MRIGIIANEFFDSRVGTMGGFGWIAAATAKAVINDATGGVAVEFLCGDPAPAGLTGHVASHGVPLHFPPRRRLEWPLERDRFDLLLSIDYRPSYDSIVKHFWKTPWVMWVNDPRPPEDVQKIATLSIPGQRHERPQGIGFIDCTGMAGLRSTWWRRRPVVFAAPEITLFQKFQGTYGFSPPASPRFLPYPLQLDSTVTPKTDKPSVVFLGRLDPIKRPWVFVEVARTMPDVDFILMGQAHHKPPGAWAPEHLPTNVQWAGHIENDQKWRAVSSAWALVNTSIHEALPVSFIEAFAAGTPVISCQDPGGLVTRFGTYVGRVDGDGMDAVPLFAESIRAMTRRRSEDIGRQAHDWATAHHTRAGFQAAIRAVCDELGITVPCERS